MKTLSALNTNPTHSDIIGHALSISVDGGANRRQP